MNTLRSKLYPTEIPTTESKENEIPSILFKDSDSVFLYIWPQYWLHKLEGKAINCIDLILSDPIPMGKGKLRFLYVVDDTLNEEQQRRQLNENMMNFLESLYNLRFDVMNITFPVWRLSMILL
eukprot:168133_1